ncbi:MAG TPA: methionine--tRNA ligase [Candidatus Kapabacteria bacterium]|nr:methionine--tRNA ligase [Candidatus Kapabacteria bacterium]
MFDDHHRWRAQFDIQRGACAGFKLSFDHFGRSSNPPNHKLTQHFCEALEKHGLIEERVSKQIYSIDDKRFLPDRYVEGTCPVCGFERARGDQCDNCGAYYNQTQLKNPVSLVSGKTPEIRSTKHWYFKLGDFQQQMEEYLASHEAEWKDNVVQQTRSWLKQGLADRAATRDMAWGIPVPAPDAEGKVIYVWFEAVLGYISATKQWAMEQGKPDDWQRWWRDKDTRYIAFLGKDNIVFHTIIFPILLSAKDGYILPDNVPANEFLNLEGQKFSKSRQWGIDLQDFQRDFPLPSHTDVLRYTLAVNAPETRDSDFTWRDFQAKNNNELAAVLGNYCNRVLQFIHKNFEGKTPALPERYAKLTESWKMLIEDFRRNPSLTREQAIEELAPAYLRYFSEHDFALISAVYFGANDAAANFHRFRLRDAVLDCMNIARAANKYFNDTEPWKTIKNDSDTCAKTLFICVQVIRSLSVYFAPIIPHVAATMQSMIGEKILVGNPENPLTTSAWHNAVLPHITPLSPIEQPVILFEKIEDAVMEEQRQKLGGQKTVTTMQEQPELITIDDFKKIQLRTATVLAAERVPKSEKLLKLQVDTGADKRQILAGIGKFYTPEEMVGKTVVVVVNLQPAKLMGQVSQGMLLAANTADGGLSLVTPEIAVAAGAEVR